MRASRFLLALTGFFLASSLTRAENWPAWRGPTGQGLSTETSLPTEWSPSKNVKWKIALPDSGNSTPIVWGDKIFLTQSTEKGKKRSLWCLNRADGSKLWEKAVSFDGQEPKHDTNTYCAASPVTDGERIVVSHGSAGVYCYDFTGKELWHRELGSCRHIWGNASSPVLYKNLAILNFGPNAKTFLLAMDLSDGTDAWKVAAEGKKESDFFGSWSTPVLAEVKGRTELVMTWPGVVKAYNPENGSLLWGCTGLEKDKSADRLTYASPLISTDGIVAAAGYGGPAIGIKPGGIGDITASHRLWRTPSNPQRIGSGVIAGEHAYLVNEPGLACIELKTGKELWTKPIREGVWGSIVLADGKLYVASQKGVAFVIEAKPELKVLAQNALDGATTRASLAPSQGCILIRTYKNLWCIGK